MRFSSHQPIVCSASRHQERALFIHASEGGPESLGRRLPFCLPFTAGHPTKDFRLSPACDLLFISSLLLVIEWGTVTHWSVMRALLLLQEVRSVSAQTHRIEYRSDLGKPRDQPGRVSQPPHYGHWVVGAVLCFVGSWAASLASTHQMPAAPSPAGTTSKVSRDCLQIFLWRTKAPPAENHCSSAMPHFADRKLRPREETTFPGLQLVQQSGQEPGILMVSILRSTELPRWALQTAVLGFVFYFVSVPAPRLAPLSPAFTL